MSFTLQKPTPIEVKLFENSTVFRMPYQNFKQNFTKGNYGHKMTRIIAEASFIEKQQQQIDLQTKNAKERYLELIKSNNRANVLSFSVISKRLCSFNASDLHALLTL